MKNAEKIEFMLAMEEFSKAEKDVIKNKEKISKKLENSSPEEAVEFLAQMIREQNKKRGEKDDKGKQEN